ncbi:GTP-binding protein Rhes [Patagioenas fasciata monilis]|uniref:GTP-binding protein Rhes n=2 Tax=Columbidae TaxID=8930 RepID=A0A1V4JAN3_PATFA|nr:GTP-binding protein Rhes [Patagioenas fasciata monilis]
MGGFQLPTASGGDVMLTGFKRVSISRCIKLGWALAGLVLIWHILGSQPPGKSCVALLMWRSRTSTWFSPEKVERNRLVLLHQPPTPASVSSHNWYMELQKNNSLLQQQTPLIKIVSFIRLHQDPGLLLQGEDQAMMKTMSGGNCTLNVPAKNSYRMVVLGASRVGKSSIVSRFLNGRFEDQYTPTIEDFHRKVYNIRGDMYQLDILDTSGNHPFPAMRRLSILTGDVFILVFSLDNRESFDEVKRLQKQILEVKSCLKNKTKESADLPMVICGNKNDHSEVFRKVRSDEGEDLVSSDENCAYFEVSAKKNTNVDEMFYVLFSMAKLPHEMSPALHRKISIQYGDTFQQKSFRMRRVKDMDAYGMISPFARRPSVNSDLKYIKSKVLREGQSREREKCTIQ